MFFEMHLVESGRLSGSNPFNRPANKVYLPPKGRNIILRSKGLLRFTGSIPLEKDEKKAYFPLK